MEILHGLKIPQYAEVFTKEDVTGWILVNCTDAMLENELLVSSRLHRMRLMQLIKGMVSARPLVHSVV